MTDPTVVVPFVPRQGRSVPSRQVSGAGRTNAAEQTSVHLTRIAASLGMPVGAFFDEVFCRGTTIPDPGEVLEMINAFHRIENIDERRRIMEIAKSALEGEDPVRSDPSA